mgnify:CR=1 FL=1
MRKTLAILTTTLFLACSSPVVPTPLPTPVIQYVDREVEVLKYLDKTATAIRVDNVDEMGRGRILIAYDTDGNGIPDTYNLRMGVFGDEWWLYFAPHVLETRYDLDEDGEFDDGF